MSSYQDMTIIGNVGGRPTSSEVNGNTVCNFNVAINDRNGNPQWFRISAWGRQAAACLKYIHKGKKVLVAGTLSANIYTSRGEPKIGLNINARIVKFLSKDGYIEEEADMAVPF